MKLYVLSIVVFFFTIHSAIAQIDSANIPQPLAAQQSTVEIIMKDGNILRGTILSQNVTEVNFTSVLTGNITIPQSQILDIKYFDIKNTGNRQVYINLSSRYFFAPSGINMKKGDGYYQNTWFFLQSFNYAITDHITLGGGFELFSLLFGKPLFYVAPKVNFDLSPKMHIGAGFLHFNYSLLSNDASIKNSLNLAFGNFTFGDHDLNASFNVGRDLSTNGGMVYTVCGFARLSPKFGVMTENWIFPSYNLYSFGGRIIGRKNLFDFGLITNKDILVSSSLGIPFLSYSLRF